ncbi:MAG: glutamine synthetase [Clostridiales bacterium]|nr:glutamine synthetase [Candidatus Blautia equi]
MSEYTKEEILQMAEDEDVEFVRLQFTDMFGALKNIAVTARELPRALDNECRVDGNFISGIVAERGTTLYLHPDLDTFTILPWRPQQGKVARMLCNVYGEDGKPYPTGGRYILKETARKAAAKGYTCYADPECEFFLFHTDENGLPTTVTHEKASYLDISPLDLGENARRDIVLTLEDMGLEVKASLHEAAPAQHEIDFRPAEMNKMADDLTTFKMVVRTIAKRHGLHATFMPKPVQGVYGSGTHVRFTLYKDGKNVFADPSDPSKLSKEAYYFAGGLLAHGKEMALITNPLVNSYKRLVPGFDATYGLSCSDKDPNSVIKVSNINGAELGVEFKSPDASANPYLLFAVCLSAGIDGIEKQTEPLMTTGEEPEESIPRLPESLQEAISIFKNSTWVKEVLGEEFCKQYVSAKEKEWHKYICQVTEWELENYLYRV